MGPALCFRSLATGVSYPGQIPAGARWIDTPRIEAGIADVRATGNLQGKPALILHGRSDALIPPNHSSRAYFGLNKIVEGASSRLSYIEIVNANHFDGFISLFGKKRLVPIHYYLDQALSKMRSHLLDPVAHLFRKARSSRRVPTTSRGIEATTPTRRTCRTSRSNPGRRNASSSATPPSRFRTADGRSKTDNPADSGVSLSGQTVARSIAEPPPMASCVP